MAHVDVLQCRRHRTVHKSLAPMAAVSSTRIDVTVGMIVVIGLTKRPGVSDNSFCLTDS